ncbi:hypothetical protein M758_1G020500 [Ceratodon purpureus]|nr:hypothetical protein M758_1G020500 [Ceratodon purpureus]
MLAMDKRVEVCYQEACGIQSCLAKNDFQMEKCRNSILELQECCKHAQYKTKHCASVKGILAMTKKKPEKQQQQPKQAT